MKEKLVSDSEFALHKRNALARKDHSKKGSIDSAILPLVNLINSMPGFYTTSSCSGRIMLIARKSAKKNEAEWLFTSHSPVKPGQIISALSAKIPKHPVWLKQENMILHIAARSIEAAERLLTAGNSSGFKRTGIISAGHRIIVSIESADSINALISAEGRMLISEEGIKALAEEANSRMRTNFSRIQRLYSALERMK